MTVHTIIHKINTTPIENADIKLAPKKIKQPSINFTIPITPY